MAPVATSEKDQAQGLVQETKAQKVFNPFYSPPGDDDGDVNYKYADFKASSVVSFLVPLLKVVHSPLSRTYLTNPSKNSTSLSAGFLLIPRKPTSSVQRPKSSI